MKAEPRSWTITRRVLYLLTALAVSLLIFVNVSNAGEVKITFQWDADVYTTDDAHMKWEALHIYQRADGESYNYTNPDDTPNPDAHFTQSYEAVGDNEESRPTTYLHTTTVPDGAVTQLYWVIRAAARCTDPNDPTTCDIESADSEEVGMQFDLSPLAQFTFTAAYNDVNKTIDMVWQNTDVRITRWEIFTADVSGGPYTLLTTVQASAGNTSYSVPMDQLFPAGQETTKYFTMVAFAPYGVFSPNAPEAPITVDRVVPPQDVVNFQIVLTE